MNAADYRRSASQRTLALRARGDLQIVEVMFAGQEAFVVKDPVAGEAFHLTAEEHALLMALRRPASLRSLQRILEEQFAPRRASILQLQQFINQLYDQGLLIGDNPGQGEELLTRGTKRRRRQRWASLASILSIKLGSFSAGPLIDRLYALFGWLGSRWALMLAAVFVVGSGLAAIGNAEAIAARLPQLAELAQPRYLPAWIAAIAGVKVLHELGHALACRRFGTRPQEIGVLLLAGAPSLYCDVSDAWRLPSKWQRMAVSSAGMGVELVIAAAALFIWQTAEPGVLSAVCLSLVTVCSVGTLLVNANPLLRYDGYYLLSDWLEVPNLAERSRGLTGAAWRRWLLNDPVPVDPLLSPRKRRALWIYAILSKTYLAIILMAMFALFVRLARPYQLENGVYTLAAVVLAGIVARPVLSASKLLANPGTRNRFRWFRLGCGLLLLAAAIGGVLMIPIMRRVEAPLVIVPARSHPLFAIAPGELRFTAAPGAWVESGDEVARLSNPEIELAIAQQRGVVRERRVRLAQLKTLQGSLPSAARTLPAAAAELADAEAQLAEQEAMAEKLVVRAPAAGRVLPPPERPADRSSGEKLGQWDGSPLDSRNLGAWIAAGTPLAVVAELGGWTAWAGVEQAEIAAVETGQAVRLMVSQEPMTIFTGRVANVARQARSNRPHDAPAPPPGSESLGDAWYHVVDIELDDDAAPLLPAARGTAKIDAYRSTFGALVLRQLQRTFRRVF